jgi:hypothetical protein
MEFGPVIVSRTIEIVGADGGEVIVEVAKPYPNPKGDWSCEFRIRGLGDGRARAIHGVDGMQALQLVFVAIRGHLQMYADRLAWLGEPLEGDMGFPQPIPSHLGPEFTQRIEDLIEREASRLRRDADEPRTCGYEGRPDKSSDDGTASGE